MYGMVNKAIREYIEKAHGEEIWQRVASSSGLAEVDFVSMESYPDAASVALVVSTSEVTGIGVPALLESIGEYWVTFALRSDYGVLLQMAGDTLPEVLMNLDQMHTRIGQSFTRLQPPSFWCTDVTDTSLVLHYLSTRGGLLAPMVVGLVRGLGTMLGITCEVVHEERRDAGAPHDTFRVVYGSDVSVAIQTSAGQLHA